jgi:hypothetical protein
MKKSFTLLLLAALARGFAQSSPTPADLVEEGVYVDQSMWHMDLLELKNGRFRYWHSSDARVLGETEYPVAGSYTTNGSTIAFAFKAYTFKASINGVTNSFDHYQTNHWTFTRHNGQIELWRTNVLGNRQILLPTNAPAQRVWNR